MKLIINLFTCLLFLSVTAQEYINLETSEKFQCNWSDSHPDTSELDILKKYETSKIQEIFNELSYNSNIEFNYPQGGCQHRAHIMSMLLDKKLNIEHSKVWLFAPIDLEFEKKEMLFIDDKNNLTTDSNIKWNYHVAPIIINKNNDTLVIDPSLDRKKPLEISKWLKKIGNSQISKYTFINPNNYFFYVKKKDGKFTNVISGCFYKYIDYTKNNFTLEKGLALNDVAIEYFDKYMTNLQSKNTSTEKLQDLRLIFGNATTIGNIFDLKNGNYSNDVKTALERNQEIVNDAQKSFDIRLEYWKKIIVELGR
jgi:hypothetical protein